MSSTTIIPARRPFRFLQFFQAQDFAWALFVTAIVATTYETNYDVLILIISLGVFEIAQPRLPLFASRGGQIGAIGVEMLLSYLLVGFTHGVDTVYHSIFLIPLVSAATIFELPGVIICTAIASGAYLSFFLFVDWVHDPRTPEEIEVICVRMSFYAIVAFLVYKQAAAKRHQMARTQQAAERLRESNRHLREAQASLRRSERLAALGQLTAGLAHELRNPLGTIKASAEMLTKEITKSKPDVMAEMAGYIVSEADRVNGLISSFLDFARPLQIHPAAADLRVVIEEVVQQQSELAKKLEVQITTKIDDRLTDFEFDSNLLKIALANLVQNAIQASKPGQTVELRVEIAQESVRIFVVDQGKGIAPQHLESIFNPFFTTRPEGIGLGLAIVSKIVDEHEGRIIVASDADNGTTFEITLPKEQ